MVALQPNLTESSSDTTLKSFKANNVLLTLFPDRLIVKHLGMLSKLKTSELSGPQTIMLRDIASIEQRNVSGSTHGLRQVVINRSDHREAIYVLYPERLQQVVTDLIDAIATHQSRLASPSAS